MHCILLCRYKDLLEGRLTLLRDLFFFRDRGVFLWYTHVVNIEGVIILGRAAAVHIITAAFGTEHLLLCVIVTKFMIHFFDHNQDRLLQGFSFVACSAENRLEGLEHCRLAGVGYVPLF